MKYNQPDPNLMGNHYLTPAGEAASEEENIEMMLRSIRREKAWKRHLNEFYNFKRQNFKRAS